MSKLAAVQECIFSFNPPTGVGEVVGKGWSLKSKAEHKGIYKASSTFTLSNYTNTSSGFKQTAPIEFTFIPTTSKTKIEGEPALLMGDVSPPLPVAGQIGIVSTTETVVVQIAQAGQTKVSGL